MSENNDDFPHLNLNAGELLLLVQAVRYYGRHVKAHPDCSQPSHQANQFLLSVRGQLQKNYPGLWERLSAGEQQSITGYMFDPTVTPQNTKNHIPITELLEVAKAAKELSCGYEIEGDDNQFARQLLGSLQKLQSRGVEL